MGQRLMDEDPTIQLIRRTQADADIHRRETEREAQLEREEEAAFQAAIAASRATIRSPSPTPPPVPIASTSTSQAYSYVSTSSTTLPQSARIPITQVTAANKPTITTQMAPDWMRTFEDRTQQLPAVPRRGQVDKEIVQRFRITWWELVRIHSDFMSIHLN